MEDNAKTEASLNESAAQENANSQQQPPSTHSPNDPASPSLPNPTALDDCKTEIIFVFPEVASILARNGAQCSENFSVEAYKDTLSFQLIFLPINFPSVQTPAPVPGAPVAAVENANDNNNNNNNNNNNIEERVNEGGQNVEKRFLNQFVRISLRLVHCAKEIDCTLHYRIGLQDCFSDQELFKEGSVPVNSAILWEDETLQVSRAVLSRSFHKLIHDPGEISEANIRKIESLKVKVEIRISKPGECVHNNSWELCEHFRQLLDTGMKSDLELEVNGVRFKVHRAIVSARSQGLAEVIKEHLEKKDKKDTDSNSEIPCVKLEYEDMDERLFKEVLYFIYCGDVKFPKYVWEFLYAGYQLKIDGIRERCATILIQLLNMNNLSEVLFHATYFVLESVIEACSELLAATVLDPKKNEEMWNNEKLWENIAYCFLNPCGSRSDTMLRIFQQTVKDKEKKVTERAAYEKVYVALMAEATTVFAAAAAALNGSENGADNANANADVNRVDDRANNVIAGQEGNLVIDNRHGNPNPNQNPNFNHNLIQNPNFNPNPNPNLNRIPNFNQNPIPIPNPNFNPNPNLNFNPYPNLIPNRNPNLNVNPIPNYNRYPIPNPPFNPNPNPNFNPNLIPNLNRPDWRNVAPIGGNLIGVPVQPAVAPAHPFAPPNFLPQQNPPINPLPVGHYFPFAPAPAPVPNNVPVQPVNIGNDALANLMPGNPAAPGNDRIREN